MPLKISAIVPTWNRPEKLHRTVEALSHQTLPRANYEVIVVDDGSDPPVHLKWPGLPELVHVLRLPHAERSASRNRGAETAAGEVVAFVDDDMIVAPAFLERHLEAQREWPGILAVGSVSLPEPLLATAFGRFRASLEQAGIPVQRGLVSRPNFCTATNMSIPRGHFLALGGFDREILSAEDQDLALRHTASGGRIAFIPGANAIHDDDNLDIRSYCGRSEWGAEHMAPFCLRHPKLPDNLARAELNGPIRWGADPPRLLFRKYLKSILARQSALEVLFTITALMERLSPSNRPLDSLYALLLGIHLQRGFRRGWQRRDQRGVGQARMSRHSHAEPPTTVG